ncbi:MAG: S41 family peptidase [Bacteroidota bacterium]
MRLFFIAVIFTMCISAQLSSQSDLSKDSKKASIERLIQLMNDHYVFPEVAKKTELHLRAQWKGGHFDSISDNESFAKALTESVQFINKDKHMSIRVTPPFEAVENTPERMIEEQLYGLERSRRYNLGFNTVQVMEGNVGYIDLRGFAGVDQGKHMADAYMKLIANTDAVIVDLRKNGGGDPRMVQYLCSFFFDERVHLNSIYSRDTDHTEDFWTLEDINGVKRPDVPLYVLTGDKTFSGAEEFAYNMQTQKRATLVGVTTGGGANPGGTIPINEDLSVFIPTGRAINPITKANWEGVGVVPEIKVPKEEALEKAHELAKEAAIAFKAKKKAHHTELFQKVNTSIANNGSDLQSKFKACIDARLMSEDDINALGYYYMMEKQSPSEASRILQVNTMLFPNSANVYDSYGESLLQLGKKELAIKQYMKAVSVAEETNDGNLNLFKENLKKAKEF